MSVDHTMNVVECLFDILRCIYFPCEKMAMGRSLPLAPAPQNWFIQRAVLIARSINQILM